MLDLLLNEGLGVDDCDGGDDGCEDVSRCH